MSDIRKLETPKVADILNHKLIALTADFSVIEAIKVFETYKLTSAPVVNDNLEVVGFLSDSDCIKFLTNSLYYDQKLGALISQLMITKVHCAFDHWDLFELEIFFQKNFINCAPVVDLSNHLLGFVTRREILKSLVKTGQEREDYITEIKTPLEISSRQRIRMILDRHSTERDKIEHPERYYFDPSFEKIV